MGEVRGHFDATFPSNGWRRVEDGKYSKNFGTWSAIAFLTRANGGFEVIAYVRGPEPCGMEG